MQTKSLNWAQPMASGFTQMPIREFVESVSMNVYAIETLPVVQEKVAVIKDSVPKDGFPIRDYPIYHEQELTRITQHLLKKPKPEARAYLQKIHTLVKVFEGDVSQNAASFADTSLDAGYWKRMALYLDEHGCLDALHALKMLKMKGFFIENATNGYRFIFPQAISQEDRDWTIETYLRPFFVEFQAGLRILQNAQAQP